MTSVPRLGQSPHLPLGRGWEPQRWPLSCECPSPPRAVVCFSRGVWFLKSQLGFLCQHLGALPGKLTSIVHVEGATRHHPLCPSGPWRCRCRVSLRIRLSGGCLLPLERHLVRAALAPAGSCAEASWRRGDGNRPVCPE